MVAIGIDISKSKSTVAAVGEGKKVLWERVQARLNDKKHRAKNKAKRTYLLTGLIECVECGATYIGHTSTNKRGYEHRMYKCGNKYRTRSCSSKSINADFIEEFVIHHLKNYLQETNFEETAEYIVNQLNNASVDLSKEKAEIADITAKIRNGVKAILSGANFPELEEEVNRLRIRKSELEDIIFYNESAASKRKVNTESII